jgi:hypothetical protein
LPTLAVGHFGDHHAVLLDAVLFMLLRNAVKMLLSAYPRLKENYAVPVLLLIPYFLNNRVFK